MNRNNITKSGAIRSRYSNVLPFAPVDTTLNINPSLTGGTNTGVNTGTGTGTGTGTKKTTGSTWNWDNFVSGLLSTANNVLPAIFGNNSQGQINAQNEMIKQQQRTTTILWVAIGLIFALGAVLLIRKTK